MSNSKSLSEEIKSHRKKIKDMSWEQKKSHIWEYYKLHIVGTIVAIASIIALIYMFSVNNYTEVFNTVIIDGYMTGLDDNKDAMTTGFSDYLGIDGKHNRVTFNNNFTLIKTEGDQDVYYSFQKILSMATTSSIDGYLSEYENINYFSDDDELFLTDLRDILTPIELSKVSDYLIYYIAKDGTETPVAVDLTTTHIKTATDLSMKRPCFGVVVTAPNQKNAVKFIKYAFGL